MDSFWILAQATSESEQPSVVTAEPVEKGGETTTIVAQPNSPAPQAAPRPANPMFQYLWLILLVVMIYVLMFRAPRRKEQQQRKMVQSLKRNDKVRTIGGIIGIVVDVKDDEITLKVDESTNTKIKVVPGAVSRNLSQGDKD